MNTASSKKVSLPGKLAAFFYGVSLVYVVFAFALIIEFVAKRQGLPGDAMLLATVGGIGGLEFLLLIVLIFGTLRGSTLAMRLGMVFSALSLVTSLLALQRNGVTLRWLFEYVPMIVAGVLLIVEQLTQRRA